MTATLELGLAPSKAGAASLNAVAARIQGISSAASSAGDVIMRDVVIPARGTIGVELAPGSYNVQVTMPSGRIVEETCDLRQDQRRNLLISAALEDDRGFSLQESLSKSVDQMLDSAVQARTWEKATEAIISKLPADIRSEVRGSDLIRSLSERAQQELASFGGPGAATRRPGRSRKGGGALVTAIAKRVLKSALNDVLPDEQAEAGTVAVDEARVADETKVALKLGELGQDAPGSIWDRLASHGSAAKLATGWSNAPPPAVKDAAFLWRLKPADLRSQRRTIGLVKDGEGGFELLSIPAPWRCATDHRLSPVDLLVDASITCTAKSSIAVHDKALEGVLAYLDRGRLGSARPLVEELDRRDAIGNAIFYKMENPLAACAAAYVGLAIFSPGESERWDGWLPNLMNRFPEIPDAAIVHARRIVLRPGSPAENDEALAALKRAFAAGLPYFGVGVQLLREMLTLFPNDPETPAMIEAVSRIASRVDQSQMFTVLRYPKV